MWVVALFASCRPNTPPALVGRRRRRRQGPRWETQDLPILKYRTSLEHQAPHEGPGDIKVGRRPATSSSPRPSQGLSGAQRGARLLELKPQRQRKRIVPPLLREGVPYPAIRAASVRSGSLGNCAHSEENLGVDFGRVSGEVGGPCHRRGLGTLSREFRRAHRAGAVHDHDDCA